MDKVKVALTSRATPTTFLFLTDTSQYFKISDRTLKTSYLKLSNHLYKRHYNHQTIAAYKPKAQQQNYERLGNFLPSENPWKELSRINPCRAVALLPDGPSLGTLLLYIITPHLYMTPTNTNPDHKKDM